MKARRAKYGNTKCEYDGELFDSRRERDRWIVLVEAQSRGIISELVRQPRFELLPAIKETYTKHLKTKDKLCERTVQLPITYAADFAYVKDGERVVEDVKISPKMLPKEFVLKSKMMRYFHGIKVRCIYKPGEEV